MNILHTITDLGIKSGGTSSCIYNLVKYLKSKHLNISILSFTPQKDDKAIGNDDFIKFIPIHINTSFYWSKTYKYFLQKNTQFQLYHTNGLWQYPSYLTARIARKAKKPYIISPHGMLYPQALKKNALKKKIALALFFKKDLQRAACIHATCNQEMIHLRELGITSPIAVIPNPIDIEESHPTINRKKEKLRIGYLGRIHPRKNIERLIYAWKNLDEKIKLGELLIIGSGDDAYMRFLREEANRLNLKNIIFTGFLSGKEKDEAIDSIYYLVVPSDFENFGMIIPEALIRGIPVIASKGTPWEDLETHRCGWWIENDIDTITSTIETAINVPEEERQGMGQRGKELVKSNYSIDVVAEKMIKLYDWILNGGDKPDFVFL